jgi:hypothetical protein
VNSRGGKNLGLTSGLPNLLWGFDKSNWNETKWTHVFLSTGMSPGLTVLGITPIHRIVHQKENGMCEIWNSDKQWWNCTKTTGVAHNLHIIFLATSKYYFFLFTLFFSCYFPHYSNYSNIRLIRYKLIIYLRAILYVVLLQLRRVLILCYHYFWFFFILVGFPQKTYLSRLWVNMDSVEYHFV